LNSQEFEIKHPHSSPLITLRTNVMAIETINLI
jgi:hypothetical protein